MFYTAVIDVRGLVWFALVRVSQESTGRCNDSCDITKNALSGVKPQSIIKENSLLD